MPVKSWVKRSSSRSFGPGTPISLALMLTTPTSSMSGGLAGPGPANRTQARKVRGSAKTPVAPLRGHVVPHGELAANHAVRLRVPRALELARRVVRAHVGGHVADDGVEEGLLAGEQLLLREPEPFVGTPRLIRSWAKAASGSRRTASSAGRKNGSIRRSSFMSSMTAAWNVLRSIRRSPVCDESSGRPVPHSMPAALVPARLAGPPGRGA